ncbi:MULTISPECIES: pyridoxal-phosphate-dependent aminotransferase family protein [Sanguibacteroides]|uniref:Aminotransferase n=1 Tax=Sanguibacteroides justesenii TaxID=1547597 RepID=A0A0C3MCL0_9PORP|nr:MULTISPECIES: aminotransferase class V-fold PLP-dependent enzyme [Sanguibacteroides]KIO44168.1 aminotransferase [Sanguibacteroides justesenii]PXZ43805.1 alanine--glyoxylate aminotransferase family protein [Sanguibacteroides justesenii]
MEKYLIPLVPGPVSVPKEVLNVATFNYGSADLEPEFLTMYRETERLLQKMMNTKNHVVIQTGEGMLALWTALKSTLVSRDRVLVISTGIFGYGFGEMAESIGCEVKTLAFGFDETITDFDLIEKAIKDFQPKMITLVQNETPSGTMNPVKEIGDLKVKYDVPLLCVDIVSGLGGSCIDVDGWNVDLALGGSQKCLSAPANMAFLSVSEKAWEIVKEVAYPGYEALLPFLKAVETGYFPYTPYWHGIAQLRKACELIFEEGLENCINRHHTVAEYCRGRIKEMGLKLYPLEDAICSPTVTAVYVPEHMTWEKLDSELRLQNMVVGGNYSCLAGKVFRIGHMGSQANMNLVKEAMDILETVIHNI